MLRRILHSKQFIMGLTLVLILCFIAIFADQLAPHDPNEYHPDARLQAPEWFSRGIDGYIFGTDSTGRDILSRMIIGAKSSMQVVGFKPSRFRVPTGPSGWDPGGTVQFILSRTVRDSAAMLDAIEGPDPGYYGIAAPHDLLYTEAVRRDPRKLRIAYMTRTPYGKPFVSPECVEAVLSVVDILRALGHTCVEAYPEISEQYHDARVMYMNDGIVLEIQQMAEETGCPIDETTLEPLVYKTYLDALSRKGMEVFRARRELARAGREMGRFFQSYDLLISPTCGRIGRPLGTLNGVVNSEISASEWARKRRDYACIAPLANVAGLPSISLPLYMSDSGLPIGVEIDGAIDQDELVLQLSAQLERAAPWSERKPPIYVSEI